MSELYESLSSVSTPLTEKWIKDYGLKLAEDPNNITEGTYAIGKELKVTDLANCLGVGLIDEAQKNALAAHIAPFGGEDYSELAQNQTIEWTNKYISQIAVFNPNPNKIVIRSREIGSRPLFHGKMIQELKARYPDASIDIKNGTEIVIHLE